MKRVNILLIGLFIFVSCESKKYKKNHKTSNSGITYFKDEETGLCFGEVQSSTYLSFSVKSITCVPCDSLKKIGIH